MTRPGCPCSHGCWCWRWPEEKRNTRTKIPWEIAIGNAATPAHVRGTNARCGPVVGRLLEGGCLPPVLEDRRIEQQPSYWMAKLQPRPERQPITTLLRQDETGASCLGERCPEHLHLPFTTVVVRSTEYGVVVHQTAEALALYSL